METCLMKKLKGSADTNAPKYGELYLQFESVETFNADISFLTIAVENDKEVTLRIEGDGYMSNTFAGLSDAYERFKEISYYGSKGLYFSNGNFVLSIISKYDLTRLARRRLFTGINSPVCPFYFDIDNIKYTSIKDIVLGNSPKTSGDISSLADKESEILSLINTSVKGNVAEMGSKPNLTRLVLGNNQQLTGDLTSVINDGNSLDELSLLGKELSFDMSALKEHIRTSLNAITVSNTSVYGNISVFQYATSSFTGLNANDTDISGNIASLANLTLLTQLNIQGCVNVTGSIASLGLLTNLSSLRIYGTTISGSIEEFVTAQKAGGRSSCESIGCPHLMSQLTFGGSYYLHNRQWLSWDDHKIVMSVDTTGTQTQAQASLIYAKGATAEEIAAWVAAEKIVILIP